MKVLLRTLPVLLALCAGMAQAQLYKSVGPDGKVTYSDTPPPAQSASKVETRPAAPGAASTATAGLPYELAQAVRNAPVTLYTSANCQPCGEARQLLNERGIPFREKTVSSNEDILQLRKVGGDASLPLLTIGRTQERGFEPTAWHGSLTAAGYPTSSRLPRTYRNPAPEPAAGSVASAASAKTGAGTAAAPSQEQSPQPATELPPATGNAPPGFRF